LKIIGVPEWHGMIDEKSLNPPEGYLYRPIGISETFIKNILKSPIRGGFFGRPENGADLIEALVLPVLTKQPWIYSTANFAEPMAFTLFGAPIPKLFRRMFLEELFKRENLKQIVCWSEAALRSMSDYAGISSPSVLCKTTVVYPGVATAPKRIKVPGAVSILFSGQFFRKGGMHVVDAFMKIKAEFPQARLRICSDLKKDFVLNDNALKMRYMSLIEADKSIVVGRVSREVLLKSILPETSVYVLPSYEEAFGFALLEALSYGVPVVASDVFAIPEIINHDVSGCLLPFVSNVNSKEIVDGYGIRPIKSDVHRSISDWVYQSIVRILRDNDLQLSMSESGQRIAREKFSFQLHNAKMKAIYDKAVQS
jgi:glycosyltransferase involved in cell wall biosynthesis